MKLPQTEHRQRVAALELYDNAQQRHRKQKHIERDVA
jgi:hypothetical protein